MKKAFKIIGIVLLVIVVLSLVAGLFGDKKNDSATKEASASAGNGSQTTAAPSAPASAWSYSSDTDQMTSKVVYHARLDADKEMELKPPYDGGSQPSLHIVLKGNEYSIYLHITKGQLIAASPGSENSIQVRFDSEPAESYSVSGPSDYSSTTVFINSNKKFLDKLKKSKKLLIATELYDNGVQQIQFNTDGLQWDHTVVPNS